MSNEKMLKNESYIVIQGFMINELNLKGNELLVYSCIYGFSQLKNQWFTGSIKYLTEWTGASRTTIISILKDFVKRGLLIKQDEIVNGVKFCKYRAISKNTTSTEIVPPNKKFNMGSTETVPGGYENLTGGSTEIVPPNKKFNMGSTETVPGGYENLTGGSTEIVPNNIEHNIDNNLVNNIDIYSEAVEYLNLKAGTKYKSSSKNTTKHIKARINDGYTLEDFKTVIDKKCSEWLNTDMEKYLCPETLFGPKFEKYLNQKIIHKNIGIPVSTQETKKIKWGE